jgi:hypothetical protein
MAEKTKQKKQKYRGYPTSVRFRCDDTIVQWLEQLANEAERNPSEYLRDLIFYFRLSSAGALVNARLLNDGIHYRPKRPLEVPAEMVFPWAILPQKEG